MKLTTNQSSLANALSAVGRAVNSRATLPVLGNVALQTDGDALKVTATDLQLGINVWTSAKVETAGGITLPARLLTEFVNSLPQGEQVTIDVMHRTMTARLKCGRIDANIKGIAIDEFPHVGKDYADTDAIRQTLDAAGIRRMLDVVTHAAATDISRPTLTGVHCVTRDWRMTFAATDGYRLAVATQASDDDVPDAEAIIPATSLNELHRLLDEAAEVTAYFTETAAQFDMVSTGFKWQRAQLVSSVIGNRFPDYTAIIPKTPETTVTVVTAKLANAIRVAQLFGRDNSNIVRLSADTDTLTVAAQSSESGDGVTVLEATIKGDPIDIAINARYMADMLARVKDETVTLQFTKANRPLRVDVDGALFVVMPMLSQNGR